MCIMINMADMALVKAIFRSTNYQTCYEFRNGFQCKDFLIGENRFARL